MMKKKAGWAGGCGKCGCKWKLMDNNLLSIRFLGDTIIHTFLSDIQKITKNHLRLRSIILDYSFSIDSRKHMTRNA